MSEDERNEILVDLPKQITLDKHLHYSSAYRPNDLYWGIGIEREFYLESSKVQTVKRDWLLANQRPERYSVRYFQSYKPGTAEQAIKNMFSESELIKLPILFNAHALNQCDCDGQHQTTFESVPKSNPCHDGKVIFEYLRNYRNGSNTFTKDFERSFCFDGDSIELTTQNFYKCKAEDAIEELQHLSASWITEANGALMDAGILKEHLPIRWATANHGLAVMWTNPKNVAIFNNGTYHINLTAPTQLGPDGLILDRADFVARHKKIIRFFQWIEPLLIVKFGSGDILGQGNKCFARGSLRCAMSRYIGVGTYDTDTMQNGKIKTVRSDDTIVCDTNGWYDMYHRESCYTKLDEVGLDILFNKHFNHGIELRIFDWFPENRLYELLRVLILCMDQALSLIDIPDPRKSSVWNKMCMRSVSDGCKNFRVCNLEIAELRAALGLRLRGSSCDELWTSLKSLVERWSGRGLCATHMLRPKAGCMCTM